MKGLGGISRVARIWENGNLFQENNILFIPSVPANGKNRIHHLILRWMRFITCSALEKSCVWIHTSANKSFYRKSLFILTASIFRKKIVLHIHPSHFYDYLISLKGIAKWYVFFALQRISVFVVLTADMQHKIRCLFPNKLIFILQNPVDVISLKSSKNLKRSDNRLLFLGWYIPEKGVYELVDAVEQLLKEKMNVELDFYGTKQVDRLKDYVKQKKLHKRIRVNGWINMREKIDALHTSTMLILPSHSEGIPNVILEAMATETPILSTPVGGLSEILQDGVNAIFAEPRNVQMLSEKIRFLLENRAIRERIAQAAYEDAMNKYDISIIKCRFNEILSSVCKSAPIS